MNMLPDYQLEREKYEERKEMKKVFDDLDFIRIQLYELACQTGFMGHNYFKLGCLYETARSLCERVSKNETWFKDSIDKQNKSCSE